MDDRTFDKQTAFDWIKMVEAPGKSFRDEFIYPLLLDLIAKVRAKFILDIGCGQGIYSSKIDFIGCHYTGIEPSSFLLDRAKELYSKENRDFLLGNAYDLPTDDKRFDLVFSSMVWHLLSDLDSAASELSRVLNDKGSFLIVSANPDAYSVWKSFYPGAKLCGKKLEGTMKLGDAASYDIIFLHTLDEIRDSLSKFGLVINETQTFVVTKKSNLLISIQGTKQ